MHQLRWFKNRIGKRIYRNKTSCNCLCCKEVVDKGLVVYDESHAEYLYLIQMDFKDINYRDKK